MTHSGIVFLSYRSQQVDFSLRLAADLKNAGIRLWMDRLDGIQIGMHWREALRKALEDAAAVIAVISPEYLSSSYCLKELGRADTLQHTIYPLMLREVEPKNMPLQLEGIQYEDFTWWPNELEYLEKFNKLILRLHQQAPHLFGLQPDIEVQYLNSLRVKLEEERGVLQYVDLEANSKDVRPEPKVKDEWGFSELLPDVKHKKADDALVLNSIKEVTEKYSRFIIIGEPGTGKTTTLRRLAREAVLARLDNPRLNPLPVLIRMAQWGDQPTAQAFIESQLPFTENPSYKPITEDTIFFLDGLNELGGDKVAKTKLLNLWLSSECGPKYVILTCRKADYNYLGREISGLPVISVQSLSNDQIQKFAFNYLGNRADGFLDALFKQASVNDKLSFRKKQFLQARRLSDLAQNPYMLSALIYLYDNSPEKEIPKNSGILMKRLVRALWVREQQRGTVEGIDYLEVESYFSQLAFQMIQLKWPLDIPLELAFKNEEERALLQVGHSLNYILISGDQVRFYHQLLQEYFAAVELEKQDLSAVTEPFSLDFGPNYIWLKYNYESRWYMPLKFVTEITDNPGLKIRQIGDTNPLLATECMAIMPDMDYNLIDYLATKTLEEINSKIFILLERQDWVSKNRGASGKWDDIEDSIVDSLNELYSYGSDLLSQLGNPVKPHILNSANLNQRLVTETLNKMESSTQNR